MKSPPSRDLEKFVIRLPAGMRERIAQAASEAGRSMNAEIVYRLDRSFPLEEVASLQGKMIALQDETAKRTEEIVEKLASRLLEALTQLSANKDGTSATIGETIKRAKNVRAKAKKA